jgi:hypothetical protein
MSRRRKDGIFISNDVLMGMRLALSSTNTSLDALLSEMGSKNKHGTTSKSSNRSKNTYFLRPVQANDCVRDMMRRCIDMGVDVSLRHTHETVDGSIATCQSDVKTLLAAYLKASDLDNGGLITIDELLWSGMSENYKLGLRDKGALVAIGESLCIRKDRGTLGSLASELIRE